ncbi:MAG: hypothetical protein M3Z26_06305 [Bacteroidota bacterium]|nr:hypothetical protein [Bacteroidota bacterium]
MDRIIMYFSKHHRSLNHLNFYDNKQQRLKTDKLYETHAPEQSAKEAKNKIKSNQAVMRMMA